MEHSITVRILVVGDDNVGKTVRHARALVRHRLPRYVDNHNVLLLG